MEGPGIGFWRCHPKHPGADRTILPGFDPSKPSGTREAILSNGWTKDRICLSTYKGLYGDKDSGWETWLAHDSALSSTLQTSPTSSR